MSWGQDEDNHGRHRGNTVQGELLAQRKREGGGYEVKVKLPGGYILDKIPVAAGNRYVGPGAAHTVHLTLRNGDKNQYEALWLAGDPKKEYTPEKVEGFLQNPNNPDQRITFNDDGVQVRTAGKDTVFNEKYTLTANGILKGPNGVSVNLETGLVSGTNNTINLNTGQITGALVSSSTINATNIP